MESTSPDARHILIRRAWITTAIAVAVVALGFGFYRATASPRLCGGCHEIAPQVESWKISPHAQVGCPACHEAPQPWYGFPKTMAVRASRLSRDVRAHFTLGAGETVGESLETSVTVPDSNCEQCHTPGRAVTIRYGTLIDHEEHAERNKSCISCHVWTVHFDPGAERPLLLMLQCFTCHSHESDAKAPGDCEVCHPPSFNMRPETHKAAKWKTAHNELAKADRSLCLMCHEASMCDTCHGLEMPHPEHWTDGRKVHGPVAVKNRLVCERCHGTNPDFCRTCHHKAYNPANGSWLAQHPQAVTKSGAAACFECHVTTFCAGCHAPLIAR
ncbi:MAG: NapC/NirT family cytochrome c [Actinomycetota bacterium]|nr:NapC/NirT family cytochrome c [Actinomycetota bacterium]